MNKHSFKTSPFLSETAIEGQNITDPFQSAERSKSCPHENRLNYSEISQKSSKNEEIKS